MGSMPEFDVNLLAVLVATLAYFALGAAWYMALSDQWLAAIGKTREQVQAREQERGGRAIYPAQFVATLLLVLAVAYWVVNVAGARGSVEGVRAALLLTPVAVLASSGDFLYEGRGLRLFLINSGYRVVGLALAGAILGYWH
jgi:Protein of unknown function (DUF1761)